MKVNSTVPDGCSGAVQMEPGTVSVLSMGQGEGPQGQALMDWSWPWPGVSHSTVLKIQVL